MIGGTYFVIKGVRSACVHRGHRDMSKLVGLKIAGALILLVFLAPLLRQPLFAQEDPTGEWSPTFDED